MGHPYVCPAPNPLMQTPTATTTIRIDPDRLVARRLAMGYTQSDLAQLAGLSAQYVWALENGRRNGGIKAISKLALALATVVEDIAVIEAAA